MKSVKGMNDENAAEMKELWSVVADTNDSESDGEKEQGKVPKSRSVNSAKRKKEAKEEKSQEEIAAAVEHFMAMFEIACEDDVVLNTESKPCINKLRNLALLIETLSKKHLQREFVDHGVFTLLKNWLEPLPDGSLPNANIRQGILLILTEQFQFDISEFFFRDQLKKSGLGKVIMFLSKSQEETKANKKLAKDLVDKWSRGIYNISTRMEDTRPAYVERMPKRPCIRKPAKKAEDVTDPLERELKRCSGILSGYQKKRISTRSRVQVPEPTSMNFVFSPQSNVIEKSIIENERHDKIMKKMRQLKAMKHQRHTYKLI